MKKIFLNNFLKFHKVIIALSLTACLSCCSYVTAAEITMLGKISTASISDLTEESFMLNLKNNISMSIPNCVDYIIQERLDYTPTPRIHMFGMNEDGADFEIIVESFDLNTTELTLLDVMGYNSMVFGSNAEVSNINEINLNGIDGFEYTLSNSKFYNLDIDGTIQTALLTNSSTAICIVVIGHQSQNDFYSEILTNIVSTIKMR